METATFLVAIQANKFTEDALEEIRDSIETSAFQACGEAGLKNINVDVIG